MDRVVDQDVFSVGDFESLSEVIIGTWTAAAGLDWSVPAGTLDWSCWKTAEHAVDCVFSYAFNYASRCQHAYPRFDVLQALPDATPSDLVDGLRAATTLVSAVVH